MNNKSVKVAGKRAEVLKVKQYKLNYKRVFGLDEEVLLPGVKPRYLFNPGEDEGREEKTSNRPNLES